MNRKHSQKFLELVAQQPSFKALWETVLLWNSGNQHFDPDGTFYLYDYLNEANEGESEAIEWLLSLIEPLSQQGLVVPPCIAKWYVEHVRQLSSPVKKKGRPTTQAKRNRSAYQAVRGVLRKQRAEGYPEKLEAAFLQIAVELKDGHRCVPVLDTSLSVDDIAKMVRSFYYSHKPDDKDFQVEEIMAAIEAAETGL